MSSEKLPKKVSGQVNFESQDQGDSIPRTETQGICEPSDDLILLHGIHQISPAPIQTTKIENCVFHIYRAKSINSREWDDPQLKSIVKEARDSYKLYGADIPSIDPYDSKSAIYLANVQYPKEGFKGNLTVFEWYSLRFVPASGTPTKNEDFEFYSVKTPQGRKPLIDGIRQKIPRYSNLDDQTIYDKYVAQSRFCTIRPYAYLDVLYGSPDNILPNALPLKAPDLKGKYAGLSFALMNQQFLNDITELELPIEYLTCLMHLNLSDNILAHPGDQKTLKMPFTMAHQIMGIPDPKSVVLDRTKEEVYALSYPGYFLDLPSLVECLKNVLANNSLSESVLQRYLPADLTFAEIFNKPRMGHFSRLGELLTIKGQIPDSSLSGDQLRDLINTQVNDGPILRMMEVDQWKSGVADMLKSAGQI